MKIQYEHKEAMRFIGFSAEIAPGEGAVKCPQFWNEGYFQKYARLWQTGKPETPEEQAVLDYQIGTFALCVMHPDDSFSYVIAGQYQGGPVPEGMVVYDLPESDYAVFTEKGSLPGSLQQLNQEVWTQWYPTEGQKYQANGMTTLEVYPQGDPNSQDYECGIWIPIRNEG